MPYSDFKTVDDVIQKFSLNLVNGFNILKPVQPLKPSANLLQELEAEMGTALIIDTEKARAEMIIRPVLRDIRNQFAGRISYFSGSSFNVDPSSSLNGEVDFLLSASPVQLDITSPVVVLVEAKNADTKVGLGQCAAQMVAAQQFNLKQSVQLPVIGASTTGDRWRMMRLEDTDLTVDLTEYNIPPQLETVLGLLAEPFLRQ